MLRSDPILPTKDAVRTPLPQPRSVYEKELTSFLTDRDQRVLLLQGRWGTGKTHFWNRFVQAERARIQEKFYSYVSLFGATSVSNVKGLIVLGGDSPTQSNKVVSGWRHAKKWFVRKRQYFEDLNVPYVGNIGALLPAAEELLIENFLVCFDDLERRNRALDLEQLFGLIAVLKEQNKCRVVIICNEEELSPRDRRTLNKYREKIIDRQLTFNPPFNENFRIIFAGGDDAIREVFERLRLNNIRVFQQTRWCVKYFEPLLKNRHDVFVERFRQQCAKLAAVHFAYSKEVEMDEIRSTSWMLAGWSRRAGDSDAATELIRALQFMPTKADDFIIAYLQDGYCNIAELEPIIDQLNHEHKRSEADIALGRFWETVWDSYHNDTARVTTEAEALLKKYHPYLPFRYSTDVLNFVKRINPSFDVDPLKELAANSLTSDADVATLRDIIAECKSPAIQKAAKEKQASLKPRKTIGELVVALGESNGWNPSDFSLLNEYSENELFEWAGKANEPNILYILAQAIARGQLESADNHSGREIGKKLRAVFDKLAKRSALDAERTKYSFERIRRILKQFGKEATLEICPPSTDSEKPATQEPNESAQ
jgi:KAP family P-loop domain